MSTVWNWMVGHTMWAAIAAIVLSLFSIATTGSRR
jgi:hypothetical protein